ncbi:MULTISPECIES: phosphopyruvate hydratase [Microbacteriaceae]|uniref:phosphopyruvate hydratase n=1 Tax=Microbacteriaceae TaxID=85023 RepID=UPI0008E8C8DC|nr:MULTISPECIES: phosphopyruvate hydratase [Microbacteriaceae]MBF4577860.1 phosphopyruvate hydratase [Frondihabitans sp. VKM Ac-2883]MBF4581449.1 phosphopyruvate hydratase [Curtobacterium sp. VKM Ac-2865]WIB61707.1 phosphopyruvate hydratase [Curtobacterium sp. MCLR17_007]SFF41006.1 enolase [Curtobacterium sp. YR515]
MNDYISNVHHTTHHQGEYVTHTSRPVTISSLHGSRILDSRGYPTIQVHLELEDGTVVTGDAPAGASTGAHEAVELRDGGSSYGGRDVSQALHLITADVAPMITGQSWTSIGQVDAALAALDSTPNYRRLGANSVVATSIAMARALAAAAELPLWRWIADVTGSTPRLPVPHFNVLNGGAHAANALDFQEFMIAPVNADTMTDAVRIGSDVYHALAALVRERFGSLGLGDEGGFAPSIAAPEEALDLLVAAISAAGYEPGVDTVAIALDPAANEFALGDGSYRVVDRRLDRAGMVDYYRDLISRYPIRSIEDGFSEDDHGGWKAMSSALGGMLQIVGDDLYVTDPQRIRDGGKDGLSNAALIKPNQIGTVSQTLDAIGVARSLGMRSMVSHRSGETTDTFIADLVVGSGTGQIKSGAPARGERVAKYNRLTEIAENNPELPYGLR